ncbi:hypothetical protein COCSADRAFT_221567 [Bipolaris sorokiniana ND90Pr]|uniref:Uncharacterized protein n=1 Tax=Cochliobolus sativus (strain ND90Pr / ATCC 201652) TaxID=665912 RepID=M2S5T0_COCSN|nr:uncharacterized protein COCSADRAFT_221567 [Bipolaris sorokiniana ND90Pr]EMD62498.1 hypothetical protein COCSADRAFT_221567 [Bipolaris sorokiniana ND90Pr]
MRIPRYASLHPRLVPFIFLLQYAHVYFLYVHIVGNYILQGFAHYNCRIVFPHWSCYTQNSQHKGNQPPNHYPKSGKPN